MSKRRKAGDWVWLAPNSGFVGESNRLKAQILPEEDEYGCGCVLCDDPGCREWLTLETSHGDTLCHVSECEMFDQKQVEGEP